MSQKVLTFVAIPAAKHLGKCSSLLSHTHSPTFSPIFQSLQLSRKINTHALSPTVTLISNGQTRHLRNRPDLSKYQSEGRPLSILLCWLMAKNNAVKKYAEFYLDHGFDVLTVRITPAQLLLPTRVEPIVRNEILPTLLSSDHEKKLVHGFSVGGYVFARMLKYLQEHPQGEDVMNSIKGQIWDSVVDVNGVSIGVSKSVFMKNDRLQQALQRYIDFHLKAFYNVATKYYDQAHEYYYNKPLKAPALFLSSEADLISTMDVIQAVQKEWTDKGIPCDNQVWKNTQHVGHMRAHPEEYKQVLRNFLHKHEVHGGKKRTAVSHDHRPLRDMGHGIPNVVYTKAA